VLRSFKKHVISLTITGLDKFVFSRLLLAFRRTNKDVDKQRPDRRTEIQKKIQKNNVKLENYRRWLIEVAPLIDLVNEPALSRRGIHQRLLEARKTFSERKQIFVRKRSFFCPARYAL
jgi:hypothetical protein